MLNDDDDFLIIERGFVIGKSGIRYCKDICIKESPNLDEKNSQPDDLQIL